MWFFFALAFRKKNVCAGTRHSTSYPVFWNSIGNTKLITANIISHLHKEAIKVSQSLETVEAPQGMLAFLEAKLLWYCCYAFIVWWWDASFRCCSCDWQNWKFKPIQKKREIKTKLISTYGSVITSYFLVSLCAAHCFISNSHFTLYTGGVLQHNACVNARKIIWKNLHRVQVKRVNEFITGVAIPCQRNNKEMEKQPKEGWSGWRNM